VQIYLRLPLSFTAFELHGHVAWVRLAGEHPGMGVEFARDDATRIKIEKLLMKLAR
jgi:hypothetical protein